jgi:hypothetical protein
MFRGIFSVYEICRGFNEIFAKGVLVVLTLIFLFLALLPIIVFTKLKKAVEIPGIYDNETYLLYLEKIKKRLTKNKHLKKSNFKFYDGEDLLPQVEKALEVLDNKAEEIIKKTSNTIFISTAISQNGFLDAFFVLSSLSKMVWDILHLYNQRPAIKEIVNIYANIAGTVIMAKEMEDLALLDEQLEPVINSVIGGTLGTLFPGMIALTNFIINSVVQGSANAFLSLRIGIMAKKYSGMRIREEKKIIKRLATVEACALMGTIIQSNTAFIIKSFVKASKKATIDKTFDTIKKGANKTNSFVRDIFQK